jgi:cytoskeletal protein CcmA (bactofilin family)
MFNIKKNDRAGDTHDVQSPANGEGERSPSLVFLRDTAATSSDGAGAPSVLAPGAVLKGSINAPGSLHIQGVVDGDVQAPHISLGEQGTMRGRLKCGHFVLDGQMDGEVLCSEFTAGETARISGTVRCHVINLKLGASINADVLIGRDL